MVANIVGTVEIYVGLAVIISINDRGQQPFISGETEVKVEEGASQDWQALEFRPCDWVL